jgi:hypothetical protein
MSIVTNAADRADWFATVSATRIQLERLDAQIWIAMLDLPTSAGSVALMIAAQQLASATKALDEAATQIRGLR